MLTPSPAAVLADAVFRDMHDSMSLDSRIHAAFHWPPPEMELTQERKDFEQACTKWDEYQEQQRAQRRARRKGHGRAPPLPSSPSLTARGRASSRTGAAFAVGENGEGGGSEREVVPPSQRLSRTIRVFCEWKP